MEHSVDSLEENLASKINAETECRHTPTHLLKSMQRIKLTCKLLKCLPKQSSTLFKGKKKKSGLSKSLYSLYLLSNKK